MNNMENDAQRYIDQANDCLKRDVAAQLRADEAHAKSQPKSARWHWRIVSWLDAKVNRVVEVGVDDFERKCDAAARTFSTIAFTFCAVVVIVAVALKWALAS